MSDKNLPAKKQANETVDLVLAKVKNFVQAGDLHLPVNYSASNALKSAWLIIQETVDRGKKPALSVCTKPSIANALLDMVVQGLNPAKKQCYFIVYGNKLTLHRSYFGTKAVCLRVDKSISDIYAEVVYRGDDLEYSIDRGRKRIEQHKQKIENIDDANIIAAYAVALDQEGETKRCEIMTMDQLKKAWAQSSMRPIDDQGNIKPGSTHGKFTAEMAKKTVTSRLSKHVINSSSDSDLLMNTIKRNDDMAAQLEADQEADDFENTEVIDINTNTEQTAEEPESNVVDGSPVEDEDQDTYPDLQQNQSVAKPPF